MTSAMSLVMAGGRAGATAGADEGPSAKATGQEQMHCNKDKQSVVHHNITTN